MAIRFLDEEPSVGIRFVDEQPNPVDVLVQDPVSNATPEQQAFLVENLSKEDVDFSRAKAYYDQKFGTNMPPELVMANIEFEYGEGATPKVANAHNAKPAKWYKDIPEYTARLMAGAGAQMPKLRSEMAELREKTIKGIGSKLGLSDAGQELLYGATPRTPFDWANEIWRKIPSDKLQEWGAGQVEKATDIQSEYMSGKPLEQLITEGDWATAGKDIATAIGFESPMLAVQIGMGIISPEASLEMMGVRAMGAKRAEKTMDDSLEERVIAPVAVGALEIATEKFLGTQRIIDVVEKRAFQKGMANRFKQILTDWTTGGLSEGGATFGENVVDRLSGEEKSLMEGVLMSSVVGSVMDTAVGRMMTLGDATRIRKQNTDAQIDEMVDDGTLTQEEADVAKNPTDETYAEFMSAEEQRMNEDLQALVARVQQQEAQDAVQERETMESDIPLSKDAIESEGYIYSHRRRDNIHPSETGYVVQFVRNSTENLHYGDKNYVLKEDAFSEIPQFVYDEALSWLRENVNKNAHEQNAIAMVNPYNIEDGAGIWDEPSFIVGLKRKYSDELSGIAGFKLADGGVIINPEKVSFGIEIMEGGKEDAVQEREAAEVPVVEETGVGAEVGEVRGEAEQAVDQKTVESPSRITGISRNWNNAWREMMDVQNLPPPIRKRQEKAIESALEKGLADNVDQLIESDRPLTDEEVGAFLIRKADISNEIDEISRQMEEAAERGDDDLLSELREQLDEKLDFGVKLTDAAAKRATITAQGLAAMNMMMDRKTYGLVNIETLARSTKGEALTEEESADLMEKSDELQSLEDDLANVSYPTPSALLNRILIIDEVERAYRRIKKKGATRKSKNDDVKLIRSRQDKIFDLIDEINSGKPNGEKIQKVQQPDSEGYLEMINNLKEELNELRKVRRLDEQIAQMESDIEAGTLSSYDVQTQTELESEEIMLKRARKLALQKEINRQIAAMRPKTVADYASDVWDIFRNLRLTADAGHLLRQGGVVISNPTMWKDGDAQQFFTESMKALVKEEADLIDANIMAHKSYNKWKLAGLAFVEEGGQLDAREEILMMGALGRAPLGIGKAQRAFGRTQITGTNLLRLLAAESYAGGKDLSLPEMREVATAVNILTGRGATVRDQRVNRVLNKILTSPSFTASRFQAPFVLAHKQDGKFLWQNKDLRNRVLQDYAWFLGARLAIMGALAALWPDMEIGEDPNHWTFGRLIVDVGGGNSRVYDPWAGIASAYRAIAPITEGELGEASKKVIEGRKHPALTSLQEVAFGETFYGEEIGRGEAAVKAVLPISVEGVREAIVEDSGVFDIITATAFDIVGVGSVLVDENDLEESRERSKKE